MKESWMRKSRKKNWPRNSTTCKLYDKKGRNKKARVKNPRGISLEQLSCGDNGGIIMGKPREQLAQETLEEETLPATMEVMDQEEEMTATMAKRMRTIGSMTPSTLEEGTP